MNKLKYIFLLISINTMAVSFFNKDINAVIEESNGKYVKEYKLSYKKDEIKLEILSPKINKGEIYTYKDNKKYIYYPSIDETVMQSYANEDNDIILSLAVLRDINKTTTKDGKLYVVKDDKIKQIKADNYVVDFKYKKNKISEIKFKSNDEVRTYKWKY